MSDFSQRRQRIAAMHLLGESPPHLRGELWQHSRRNKAAIIIPTLASEFSEPENLPVFENILRHLKDATYLSYIIFGLDQATLEQARTLRALATAAGLNNILILWNNGPGCRAFYEKLAKADFDVSREGKGKNMFLSIGMAIALGVKSVAILDADVRTFHRYQLERLLFPVVVLDYEFAKAFYSRISGGVMYGRVKRLLLDPLLLTMKVKFTDSGQDKMLKLIDFLLGFNYQLSGEMAFNTDLLRKMRIATNWGVEIYTLIEVYRKATSVAQVEFSRKPFDHKHQTVSIQDQQSGLHRMGVDVVATLLNALVIEEGLEVSETFFRDLAVAYAAMAEGQIKKYSDDARFNRFSYDRGAEESIVRNVFRNAILKAGDLLSSPSRQTDSLLRLVHAHPEFQPFLEHGLAKTILAVESKNKQAIFEMPQTVSWEWVASKQPGIFKELRELSEEEDRRLC